MRKNLLLIALAVLIASAPGMAWAQLQNSGGAVVQGTTQSLNNTTKATAVGTGGSATSGATTVGTNTGTVTGTNTQNQDTAVGVTASPQSSVTIDGSAPSLPQLPGLMQPPSNFSQPYLPGAAKFLNDRKFVVNKMTRAEADNCRGGSVKWTGDDRDGVNEITLFYETAQAPVPMTMQTYVGTATATGKDKPYMAVLCEAAYRAMKNGATHGLVAHTVRPVNSTFGIGFGGSTGASGLPVGGANPYAIAATTGFGTGWSSIEVQGEVMVELTGFRKPGEPKAAEAESPSISANRSCPDDGGATNFANCQEARF